jgi:threonine dehydratase
LLDATRFIAERARLVIEPSGAAGVAALLAGRLPLKDGDTVVAVLSGGNVGLERFSQWLSE